MADQPSTPPADYVPAKWVAQFSKIQIQWLAEQLQERQYTARQDAREARNAATFAESRLTILEAQETHP